MPASFLLVALIFLGALASPVVLLAAVVAACIHRTRRLGLHLLAWGASAALAAVVFDVSVGMLWGSAATLNGAAMGAGGAFSGACAALLIVRWWRAQYVPRVGP